MTTTDDAHSSSRMGHFRCNSVVECKRRVDSESFLKTKGNTEHSKIFKCQFIFFKENLGCESGSCENVPISLEPTTDPNRLDRPSLCVSNPPTPVGNHLDTARQITHICWSKTQGHRKLDTLVGKGGRSIGLTGGSEHI